jgi:pimeloyl-ACP methyl ester carboxylesterase
LGRYLADRITVIVSLSGMAWGHDAASRRGMKPSVRMLFASARYARWVLPVLLSPMAKMWTHPTKQAKALQQLQAQGSPAEQAYMAEHPELGPILTRGLAAAFANGTQAAVQEFRMLTQPWDFRLEDVTVPVHMWHGMEDQNVPFATALRVAQALPDVTTQFLPGVGHASSQGHEDEIMVVIRAAADR